MATFLVVKRSGINKTITAQDTEPLKPYIKIADGYFPLTTQTYTDGLFAKVETQDYQVVDTYAVNTTTSVDTSSTYEVPKQSTNTYTYNTTVVSTGGYSSSAVVSANVCHATGKTSANMADAKVGINISVTATISNIGSYNNAYISKTLSLKNAAGLLKSASGTQVSPFSISSSYRIATNATTNTVKGSISISVPTLYLKTITNEKYESNSSTSLSARSTSFISFTKTTNAIPLGNIALNFTSKATKTSVEVYSSVKIPSASSTYTSAYTSSSKTTSNAKTSTSYWTETSISNYTTSENTTISSR